MLLHTVNSRSEIEELELIHVPRYTYPDLKRRHNHLVYEEMLDGENYKGHTEGSFGFSKLNGVGRVSEPAISKK